MRPERGTWRMGEKAASDTARARRGAARGAARLAGLVLLATAAPSLFADDGVPGAEAREPGTIAEACPFFRDGAGATRSFGF